MSFYKSLNASAVCHDIRHEDYLYDRLNTYTSVKGLFIVKYFELKIYRSLKMVVAFEKSSQTIILFHVHLAVPEAHKPCISMTLHQGLLYTHPTVLRSTTVTNTFNSMNRTLTLKLYEQTVPYTKTKK